MSEPGNWSGEGLHFFTRKHTHMNTPRPFAPITSQMLFFPISPPTRVDGQLRSPRMWVFYATRGFSYTKNSNAIRGEAIGPTRVLAIGRNDGSTIPINAIGMVSELQEKDRNPTRDQGRIITFSLYNLAFQRLATYGSLENDPHGEIRARLLQECCILALCSDDFGAYDQIRQRVNYVQELDGYSKIEGDIPDFLDPQDYPPPNPAAAKQAIEAAKKPEEAAEEPAEPEAEPEAPADQADEEENLFDDDDEDLIG